MNTPRPVAAVIAAALLASACSSVPVHVDSGPIKARTFSFVQARPKPPTGVMSADDEAHVMIQRAIAADLAAKGLRHVPEGGNVTVAYLVILGNNVATTSINDYFGYGRDAADLLEIARAYTDRHAGPDYFEAGTLVVDFIDPTTNRLLSRNYATRSILRDTSPADREARIREAVSAVLAKARIGP